MKKIFLLFILLGTISYAQLTGNQLTKNQKKGVVNVIADTLSIVTPEHYGVTGDGEINDSSDVANMFEASLGKTLMFTDTSYVWDKVIDIDCDGKNISIISPNNSQIYSTATNPEQIYFAFWVGRDVGRPEVGSVYSTGGSTFEVVDTLVTENILAERISGTGTISTTGTLTRVSSALGSASYPYTTLIMQDGRYYLQLGAINFRNAKNVDIQGIDFQFDNNSGYTRAGGTQFNGITLENCDNVVFRYNTISDAVAWGLMVKESSNIDISYNTIDSCLLGNLGIVACTGGNINYNTLSNSGVDAPANGYGVSLSHQFGTGTSNANITVNGNRVLYNLRKGIDVHGGNNLHITNNYVKGYGDKGIGGYSSGDFEYRHVEEVNNLSITDNIVENDSAWFSNIAWGYGATGYDEPYCVGIAAGSYRYGVPAFGLPASNVIISRNRISNLTVYQGDTLVSYFGIRMFTGKANTVLISDNIMDSSEVVHGISIADGNYYSDTTYLASELNQIQNLDISGNSFTNIQAVGFSGDPGRIILVTGGKNVIINNNKIINCSAYGGFGIETIEIAPNVIKNVQISGNHIDGNPLIASGYGIGMGIYARNGYTQINNNTFSGQIITRECFRLYVAGQGTAMGNSYFEADSSSPQPLPNYYSPTAGELNITFQNEVGLDTLATMIISPSDSYPYSIGGIATFDVTVDIVWNSTVPKISKQRFYAWATNDTTGQDEELSYIETVDFHIDTLTADSISGAIDSLQLFWQTISDVPDVGFVRRLDIYVDQPKATYKVNIKFQGYRLRPYYLTY